MLAVFQFEEQEIRFVDGKPVANDVAKVLGYKGLPETINRRVDQEYKQVVRISTPGGMQSVVVLEEPGVYQLIFGSKVANAKKVQKWVLENMKMQPESIPFSDFSADRDNSGFVYLARNGKHWYKIGLSKQPLKRMSSLQTGSPLEVTLIHRVFSFNPVELEKSLHEYYSAYWLRGEWFEFSRQMVNEFPSVAAELDGQLETKLLGE
jgi:hypothetical protein